MSDAHYHDPRLAALYNAFSPPGDDTAFYLRLAGESPKRVLDLGCGTGQLATALAARGHVVTGVDPAQPMLDRARAGPGGRSVEWVKGDARTIAFETRFDLILMTGHVFQVFLDDADIRAVLAVARRHLVDSGRLAFETRNPAVRAWERWTPEVSKRRLSVDGIGPVEESHRLISAAGGRVVFETDHHFIGQDAVLTSRSALRFIEPAPLAEFLAEAGFVNPIWLGDWNGAPFTNESPEIIVVAQ